MKKSILTFFAIIFFTAGAALADTVTQEVVNVQKYVKGKTTLNIFLNVHDFLRDSVC